MTLDTDRTHLKMILQEVAFAAVLLNLALHDLSAAVATPGSSHPPTQPRSGPSSGSHRPS